MILKLKLWLQFPVCLCIDKESVNRRYHLFCTVARWLWQAILKLYIYNGNSCKVIKYKDRFLGEGEHEIYHKDTHEVWMWSHVRGAKRRQCVKETDTDMKHTLPAGAWTSDRTAGCIQTQSGRLHNAHFFSFPYENQV